VTLIGVVEPAGVQLTVVVRVAVWQIVQVCVARSTVHSGSMCAGEVAAAPAALAA
jgi:hypothetical protein